MRFRFLMAALLMTGCAAPTVLPVSPQAGSAALSLFSGLRSQPELLIDGDQIFPAAYDLVANAKTSVQINIFLFGGAIGRKIGDMLLAKKAAGVDVQLITDVHMGYAGKVRDQIKPLLDDLQAKGLDVRFYPVKKLPQYPQPWLKIYEPITHAKVLVADHNLALVGGMNFLDSEAINRDYMVRVKGDLAAALGELVDRDWRVSGGDAPRPAVKTGEWEIGEVAVDRQTVKPLWLKALNEAQHSIDMEMLLMDHPEGLDALIAAQKRGVKVRILLDKTNFGKHSLDWIEKLPLKGAPNWLAIKRLTEAGVQVAWYKPRQRWEMLHAKNVIIDGTTVLMGTANFTRRAWGHNREFSVRFNDPALAAKLGAEMAKDWQLRAEPITRLTRWQAFVASVMARLENHKISPSDAEREINKAPEDGPDDAV